MKKLLSILLIFISFGAIAQTYDTLPTGSKPYGNQLYITPDGNIVAGTGSAKFRVIGTKKDVDSLLALKQDVLNFNSGLTKTGNNVTVDQVYLNGRYIQLDPENKQPGSINIDGGINVGLNTYLGNLSLSSLYLNIDDGRGNKIANFGGYGGSVGLGGSSYINQSTYISDRLPNPSSNDARSLFDVKGLLTTDGINTTQRINGTDLFTVTDPKQFVQAGNVAPSSGSPNYIQNNNTGTPQSASFNLNGTGRFDSSTSTTLFAPGLGSFATETGVTSINGGNVNVGVELLTPNVLPSDSSGKAANTRFVKQSINNVVNNQPFQNGSWFLGDSQTTGYNASGHGKTYVNILADKNNISKYKNVAEDGAGVRRGYKNFILELGLDKINVSSVMLGFNDIRGNQDTAKRFEIVRAGHRAILAAQFTKSIQFYTSFNSSSANPNVTTSQPCGSCSSFVQDTLIDYASRSLKFGANFWKKTNITANETVTISNVQGSDIAIGTWQAVSGWSRIEVRVDGVLKTTFNPNGKINAFKSDGFTRLGIINDAIIIRSLKDTLHTVELKFLDGGTIGAWDYVAGLTDVYSAKPIYILDIPHMNSTGYNVVGDETTMAFQDALTISRKRNLASIFQGYPIYFVNINKYYNTNDASQIQADGIHASFEGQNKWAQAIYETFGKIKPISDNEVFASNITAYNGSNLGLYSGLGGNIYVRGGIEGNYTPFIYHNPTTNKTSFGVESDQPDPYYFNASLFVNGISKSSAGFETDNGSFFRTKNTSGVANAVLGAAGNDVYMGDVFGNFNGNFNLRSAGSDRLSISSIGKVTIPDLSGSGDRSVISDASGTLKTVLGVVAKQRAVSSNVSVLLTDYTVLIQGPSSGTITATLPDAPVGQILVIKRVNGGSGTVDVTCSNSIDNGSATVSLTVDQSGYVFQSAGAGQYYIIGKF